MNRLFRIASRTLCLGILAALSLVLVVTAKGIHPEVLVTFRSLNDRIPAGDGAESPAEPLQFAQADPTTRLDAPAGVRSDSRSGFQRTVTPRIRSAQSLPNHEVQESTRELPQLPPLPSTPRINGSEVEGESEQAELLDAPREMTTSEDFEVASNTPASSTNKPPHLSKTDALNSPAAPMPGEPPIVKANEPAASKSAAPEIEKSDTAGLKGRIDELQAQLQKLTTEQEQQKLSQQSFLESSQVLQEQKFQAKLNSIEESLREIKAKPATAPKSEPFIQPFDPKHPKREKSDARSTPIVREEEPGTDGEKRFSIESHQGGLRELLDTLTQKANLNLVLTINVEGDVEMSLQNATADEALKAIENTTGYVVEKAGKKVYVRPGPPMGYQREVFLPPIVKDANAPRTRR